MITIKSTDVRKNWSVILDSVIQKKPTFIKRTRDCVILANLQTMEMLLSGYHFTAIQFREDDGSVTLSLNEADLAANGASLEEAKKALATDILEYANEYYEEFDLWSRMPNRKAHLPYVLKALILETVEEIKEDIICQNGEN